MIHSKEEYLAREQDAPTVAPRTIHDNYNAPPPIN